MRRLRARDERGAVLIEFAVVFPILMLLFLALVDFALAELSDAAGSNAAREGARVGILYYDGAAGTTGSANANFLKISAAVDKKLAGNVKGAPIVTVRCLDPDGTARSNGCSSPSGDAIAVGAGGDFIEVSVTWNRKGGITGFVGNGFRTDKAVMRIVGTPPTGTAGPPPTCTITASSATPSSVVHIGGEIPTPGVTFLVTVSNVASCGTPLLDFFPPEAGYLGAQTMLLVSGNSFEFSMPAGQGGGWTAGTKTVTASANGGAATQTINFTVVNNVCLITAGSATPSTTTQTAGDLPAIVFDVTVSSAVTCGTPTLTFPAQAGYGGPQSMTLVSGNSFTFTMPATQGTWTPAATYTIVANAADGATRNISLVVSNPAPTCTLSNLTISPNSAGLKNGQIRDDVTISVQRDSTASCAVPSFTVSGPSGTGADDYMVAHSMSCPAPGLTCSHTIQKNKDGWGTTAPSSRTVTATASSSSAPPGTLNLEQG